MDEGQRPASTRHPSRRGGPTAGASLLNQVCQENLHLFHTIETLFRIQARLIEARAETDLHAALTRVLALLEERFTVVDWVVGRMRDDGDSVCWISAAAETARDSPYPFHRDELEHVVEKGEPIVLDGARAGAASEHDRTVLLAPLLLADRTVGVASLWLEMPVRQLTGMRFHLLEYVLREVAAIVASFAPGDRPAHGDDAELDGTSPAREEPKSGKTQDTFLSELILGLVHDMRTPLSGVVSGCELLRVDATSDTSGALAGASGDDASVLDVILTSAGRLQSLAADLIDLASLGCANPGAAEPADLRSIVRGAVQSFSLRTDRHELQVDVPDTAVWATCQREAIARVLENLIENAIKYSPGGGAVRVRLSVEGSSAKIAVSDEGVGIHDGDIERLWRRFERGRGTSSIDVGGHGVGLSIVKMIVDRHHGQVDAHSEPGQGSTFTVTLPDVTSVAGAHQPAT